MKFLVALSCLLAAASAKPSAAITPLAYSNVVAHHAAAVATAPVAYSSVHVSHAAPIVAAAPVAHSYAAAPVAHTYAAAPVAHTYAAAPVAHTYAAAPVAHTYAAPAVAAVATPVVAAPVVQKTQYHAQDELGQASYGHSEPFQTHNAVQDAAGNKVGSYSYVAPDGQVIAANYVADALGFRVASNALPVGPAAIGETPEVIAARAAHLNAHALARSRARRGVVAAYSAPYVSHGYAAPVVSHAYAAPVVSHAYAAPVVSHAYAAPAVRAASLTTVVNTPGHAVSYHVY